MAIRDDLHCFSFLVNFQRGAGCDDTVPMLAPRHGVGSEGDEIKSSFLTVVGSKDTSYSTTTEYSSNDLLRMTMRRDRPGLLDPVACVVWSIRRSDWNVARNRIQG